MDATHRPADSTDVMRKRCARPFIPATRAATELIEKSLLVGSGFGFTAAIM